MATKTKHYPPIHPGEILREEYMREYSLSINLLARELHVPVNRVSAIVNEKRGITADTALRLARYFRTTPGYWMNLQAKYDIEVAADTIGAAVESKVQPMEASAA